MQVYDLRHIDGLARAAREQIRDRERMRTFEVFMNRRNHIKATVLAERHFERLVILEKRAHINSKCLIRLVLGSMEN